MSELTPTYIFYTKQFGEKIPKSVFLEGIADAEAFVKYLIGWNPVDTPEKELAYKRACCVASEALALYGDGALGGFSIGSFSTSQTSSTGSQNGRDVVLEKAKGELIASGLLWGGVA